MNKYVIRYTLYCGHRVRSYFTTQKEAREFAKYRGIPYSQIKKSA